MQSPIYSVSQLNSEAGSLLNERFGVIWVAGEISNLSRPLSGHCYFSLKDDNAQIRCALFRFQHSKINFQLDNGQAVVMQAQVSLYEPRGDFQLIVTDIQLAGHGQLQIAFEKLKNELEKKGLFDEAHKKTLPLLPKRIGVITSSTGAALHDILKVLHRRAPHIPVIIYPTTVQGDAASAQIVNAIKQANSRAECDVLILARGGGSIEDLWPFNESAVAHAIFHSNIPIVTGIGHQTDFTIADFVADDRAPTPSTAAEAVSPDCVELSNRLSQQSRHFIHLMRSKLQSHHMHLMHLRKRLKHPGEIIRQQAQMIDQHENQLNRAMQWQLQLRREKLAHMAQLLDTLSPLKTLQRGFTITRNITSGKLVTSCHDVSVGDRMITRCVDGEVQSTVTV